MATLAQIKRRIASLGATLDDNDYGFNVDAPHAKVFAANGAHTLAYYRKGWLPSTLYTTVLEDLSDGLMDCDACECPICEFDGRED
jgi:hypothetical protein